MPTRIYLYASLALIFLAGCADQPPPLDPPEMTEAVYQNNGKRFAQLQQICDDGYEMACRDLDAETQREAESYAFGYLGW
jgi:hypothetical protein